MTVNDTDAAAVAIAATFTAAFAAAAAAAAAVAALTAFFPFFLPFFLTTFVDSACAGRCFCLALTLPTTARFDTVATKAGLLPVCGFRDKSTHSSFCERFQ